jgi:hypothetical protein
MILLGHELTDWEWIGDPDNNGWNRYRLARSGNRIGYIGFIANSSDLFKEDRYRCSWGVTAVGLFSGLEPTYMEMCGDKRYSYDELELATKNIDKIIMRMEKLKVFL